MQAKKISSFQIIPDRSIDNETMKEMAKELHNYIPIYKRYQSKEYNENYFTWEVKITKDNIQFFFHTTNHDDINIVKKNLPRCTVYERINGLELNQTYISIKELDLKYHYFMSLDIDGRRNEPIASLLEVQKILQENDYALIQFIFYPESKDWHYGCTDAYNQFKEGKMPKPIRFDKIAIAKATAKAAAGIGLGLAGIFQEFILEDETKVERMKVIDEDVANILRERPLSLATINKARHSAYDTTIRLVSQSRNLDRREQILRHINVSFQTLQKDNLLVSNNKKADEKMLTKIEKRKKTLGIARNILSTVEAGKLMSLPTAYMQEQYKIQTIEMREVEIPKILRDGNIPLGISIKNGIEALVYWENKYNIVTLPKVIVGPMGAGKSDYTINYVVGSEREGHGAIVLDFIKECELSKAIEKYIPQDKLIIHDMSDIKSLFSLAYTEVRITDEMSRWEKLKAAGDLADQTSYLINALNDNNSLQPLTPKMERVLNSACMVTYATGRCKVYDVINVLQNHRVRRKVMEDAIEKGIYNRDDMKIMDLESLDDYDVKGKVSGTKETRIEGIMDRVNTLMRNPYLELMLMAEPNFDIDFIKYMDEGKIVLIRIPESTFKKKWIKDTLVTYFLSRIWLATLIRGKQYKPKVCHVVTDEIHQVQTGASLIAETITEGRKFGVSYYFTCQYLKQFGRLLDGVKSAGVSYMLLSGTEKENYMMLKEELGDFTVEELLNMKRFHSFNMIRTSEGNKRFISKLPNPL